MNSDLTSWQMDSGREPRIRVGIVLPSDGLDRLRVEFATDACRVCLAVGDGDEAGFTEVAESFGSGTAGEMAAEADAVVWRAATGQQCGPARAIRIEPVRDAVQGGAGIRVHDVPTGRGFHWQKRVTGTYSGIMEFRAYGGHLLAVSELGLEQYLPGVITAEMSGECPPEFLKSQTVVARSWVLAHTENKHADWPIDRCNDDCCQRYQGTSAWTQQALDAVAQTRGQVIVDAAGTLIDTNYSKNCGGIIESPENVWSVRKPGQASGVDAPRGSLAARFYPMTEARIDEYLTGAWLADTDVFCSPNTVPDADLPRYLGSVDEGGGHFRWTVVYSREQIETLLRQKYFAASGPASAAEFTQLMDLAVSRRGDSGRAAELQVHYLNSGGRQQTAVIRTEYQIRHCLHEKFLFSSAFSIHKERDGRSRLRNIKLIGAGWGHGAGLCQIGALGMALKGHTCEQILTHYFKEVRLQACY